MAHEDSGGWICHSPGAGQADAAGNRQALGAHVGSCRREGPHAGLGPMGSLPERFLGAPILEPSQQRHHRRRHRRHRHHRHHHVITTIITMSSSSSSSSSYHHNMLPPLHRHDQHHHRHHHHHYHCHHELNKQLDSFSPARQTWDLDLEYAPATASTQDPSAPGALQCGQKPRGAQQPPKRQRRRRQRQRRRRRGPKAIAHLACTPSRLELNQQLDSFFPCQTDLEYIVIAITERPGCPGTGEGHAALHDHAPSGQPGEQDSLKD